MKSKANIYFSYSCKSMFKILFFKFLRRNKLRLNKLNYTIIFYYVIGIIH